MGFSADSWLPSLTAFSSIAIPMGWLNIISCKHVRCISWFDMVQREFLSLNQTTTNSADVASVVERWVVQKPVFPESKPILRFPIVFIPNQHSTHPLLIQFLHEGYLCLNVLLLHRYVGPSSCRLRVSQPELVHRCMN